MKLGLLFPLALVACVARVEPAPPAADVPPPCSSSDAGAAAHRPQSPPERGPCLNTCENCPDGGAGAILEECEGCTPPL